MTTDFIERRRANVTSNGDRREYRRLPLIAPWMPKIEQRFFNVNQAAQYLGVSRWTVHRLVRDQLLPYVRIKGTIRFDRHDLLAWAQKLKIPVRPP